MTYNSIFVRPKNNAQHRKSWECKKRRRAAYLKIVYNNGRPQTLCSANTSRPKLKSGAYSGDMPGFKSTKVIPLTGGASMAVHMALRFLMLGKEQRHPCPLASMGWLDLIPEVSWATPLDNLSCATSLGQPLLGKPILSCLSYTEKRKQEAKRKSKLFWE